MNKMIQIVYVSRSTFQPGPAAQGIEPNIARILAKSRANNRKNGLVGVLYFGDGCFFQCLEGEEDAVDTLYRKLEADPRHRDLKLISRCNIAQPSFATWSMKYIPSEKDVQTLLREQGLRSFDPYLFSEATTQKVLALLQRADAPPEATDTAGAVPAKHAAAQRKPAAAVAPSASGKWPRTVLLVLAAIALCAIGLRYAMH